MAKASLTIVSTLFVGTLVLGCGPRPLGLADTSSTSADELASDSALSTFGDDSDFAANSSDSDSDSGGSKDSTLSAEFNLSDEVEDADELCELFGDKYKECTGESSIAGEQFCSSQLDTTDNVGCTSARLQHFACLLNNDCDSFSTSGSCMDHAVEEAVQCDFGTSSETPVPEDCLTFGTTVGECQGSAEAAVESVMTCANNLGSNIYGVDVAKPLPPVANSGTTVNPLVGRNPVDVAKIVIVNPTLDCEAVGDVYKCLAKLDCDGIEEGDRCDDEVLRTIDECGDLADDVPDGCIDYGVKVGQCGEFAPYAVNDCYWAVTGNSEWTQDPDACLQAYTDYYACMEKLSCSELKWRWEDQPCADEQSTIDSICLWALEDDEPVNPVPPNEPPAPDPVPETLPNDTEPVGLPDDGGSDPGDAEIVIN